MNNLWRLTASTLAGITAPWGDGGLYFTANTWGNTTAGFVPCPTTGTGVGGTEPAFHRMMGVNATIWGFVFEQATATVPSARSLIVRVNGADVPGLTLALAAGVSSGSVFATFDVNQFDRIAVRHSAAVASAAVCDMRCIVLVRPR